HPSARVEADLISTTGAPSNTSIGPIFTRLPSISRTVTGCSPSGLGRAGVKHTGERTALIAARMVLQHIALRFVQPRDDDQLVIGFHSQQRLRESRFDLEPRVRSTLRSLPRRVFPPLQRRANKANRLQCVRAHPANVVQAFSDATNR